MYKQVFTLPKEYYDLLTTAVIGVILSPLASWLIPLVFDRREKSKHKNNFNTYINQIDTSNNIVSVNRITELQNLRKIFDNALVNSEISEGQYEALNRKLSRYLKQPED
jgi:hypothetical protein